LSASPSVVVADLGSGNLRSVEKALAAVGARVAISADADVVGRADKLVVPGQGAFGACAAGLDGGGGAMRQAVQDVIRAGRPFFGICIGMQLLFESSEENPEAQGLSVLPGRVRRFADRPGLKIPHMGWNQTRRGPAAARASTSSTATSPIRRAPRMSPSPASTASGSARRSGATICSAASSTPKRARRPGSRCCAASSLRDA